MGRAPRQPRDGEGSHGPCSSAATRWRGVPWGRAPWQPRDGEGVHGCLERGCNFVHYDNPVPVVAAIVEIEDSVILVRSHGWPESWYGLVTGFLERKESPEDGILREVEEELGLQGELMGLIGVYGFARMNQVIIAYHLEAEGSIVLNEELDDYKLVEKKDIVPWNMGTGLALKDYLASLNQSPHH